MSLRRSSEFNRTSTWALKTFLLRKLGFSGFVLILELNSPKMTRSQSDYKMGTGQHCNLSSPAHELIALLPGVGQ